MRPCLCLSALGVMAACSFTPSGTGDDGPPPTDALRFDALPPVAIPYLADADATTGTGTSPSPPTRWTPTPCGSPPSARSPRA